eukprot:TRINITY_DN572_c0_g2_i1.p1 TRINITY_DN572_c0_g2~~TRINITY_DN572_c0_g2_i1.p1  ORF type:complete len:2346 (+),score=781.80 TRINITY_DN572_c0_g2_i1:1253-8290(+)
MLERFTKNAIKGFENRNKKINYIKIDIDMSDEETEEFTIKKMKHWFGLEVFWNLLQEDTNVQSVEVSNFAFKALIDILHESSDFNAGSQKLIYLCKAIENIKVGKSIENSINLIETIFNRKNPLPNTPSQDDELPASTAAVIEMFEQDFGLIKLVTEDLIRFHNLVKSKVSENQDVEKLVFARVSYRNNLLCRLNFLKFLTSYSKVIMSKEVVELIWNTIFENNNLVLEKFDIAILIKWFQDIFNLISREPSFSEETLVHLFSEKIFKGDISNLSFDLFEIAKFIFININHSQKKIKNLMGGRILVLSFDFFGLDQIWKCIFSCNNQSVVESAMGIVLSAQRRVGITLVQQLLEYRKKFIETCVSYIQNENVEIVERAITLLKKLIASYYEIVPKKIKKITFRVRFTNKNELTLSMFPFDTVGKLKKEIAEQTKANPLFLRLIKDAKEMKPSSSCISLYAVEEGSIIHCVTSSSMNENKMVLKPKIGGVKIVEEARLESQGNHSLNPSFIASSYFDLIFRLLDFNPKISSTAWEVIVQLPKIEKRKDQIRLFYQQSFEWDELINSRSIYSLYYSLLIVDSVCNEREGEENNRVLTEAAKNWRQMFSQKGGVNHLSKIFVNGNFFDLENREKKVECVYLILNILYPFFFDEKSLSKDLENYIQPQLLISKLMEITRETSLIATKNNTSNIEKIIQASLSLLSAASSNSHLLGIILSYPNIENWLYSTLVSPKVDKVRKINVKLIKHLSLNSEARNILFQKLVAILNNDHKENSNEYFELINHLLEEISKENILTYQHSIQLLEMISKKILERPVIERSYSKDIDFILVGLINFASTLCKYSPEVRSESRKNGLVQHILRDCLFDIANIENNGPFAPPKCKSSRSRVAAFKLLLELSKDHSNFQIICNTLAEDHKDGHKNTLWHYSTENYEKDTSGYVGLLNLGATCYINSLTQQLFMVPELRHAILSECKVNENMGDYKKSRLYQFQLQFANLQCSEKKFYDTRNFCNAFGIVTGEQQDVDEWMGNLFDKLEEELKFSHKEKLFQDLFRIKLIYQVISNDCEHISEREEVCFSLGLEIQGKKNLGESLKNFIQGDNLVGDNKYQCAQCNNKVDAIRRCCLSELPDNLIVHMKRFSFDFETFLRNKVNSFYEIWHELDLEPYTKQGLARLEGKPIENEKPHEYFQYKLVGILVHTGSAQMGHYYSFAKERIPTYVKDCRWISFNDSSVEVYNPERIVNDCGGGPDFMNNEKQFSAYLLFYERVGLQHNEDLLKDVKSFVPKDLLEEIWMDNTKFLHDKNKFDLDYINFVWDQVLLYKDQESFYNTNYDASYDSAHPLAKSFELGFRFVVETLAHFKEKSFIPKYFKDLKEILSKYVPSCNWLLSFLDQNTIMLKTILFSCPIESFREEFVDLILHASNIISPNQRSSYLLKNKEENMEIENSPRTKRSPNSFNRFSTDKEKYDKNCSILKLIDTSFYLVSISRDHWKFFGELFRLIYGLCKLGYAEKKYIVDQRYIVYLLDWYLGDESPLDDHSSKRPKMIEGERTPNLKFLFFFLIDILSTVSLNQDPLQLTEQEVDFFTNHTFLDFFFSDCQDQQCISQFASKLCTNNSKNTKHILDVAFNIFAKVNDHSKSNNILEFLKSMILIQDQNTEDRVNYIISNFFEKLSSRSHINGHTLLCVSFIYNISEHPQVASFLLKNVELWVKPYLYAHSSWKVRTTIEKIIYKLFPKFPPLQDSTILKDKDRPEKFQLFHIESENEVKIPEEMRTLYYSLIQYLFEEGKNHGVGVSDKEDKLPDDVFLDEWKLVSLFRVLRWCLRENQDMNFFAEIYGSEMCDFFINCIDNPNNRFEQDLNKQEFFHLWLILCKFAPENKKFIFEDKNVIDRIIHTFISLKESERYINYNRYSLYVYYSFKLELLGNSSFYKAFFETNSFNWSINFLWMNNNGNYPEAGKVIKTISSQFAKVQQYRKERLLYFKESFRLEKMKFTTNNVATMVDGISLFMQTNEDAKDFIEYGLLDYFSEYLLIVQSDFLKNTRPFEQGLKIFTMCINNIQERKSNLNKWDNKIEAVTSTLNYLSTYPEFSMELTTSCYTFLEVISSVDFECVSQIVDFFLEEHRSLFVKKVSSSNIASIIATQDFNRIETLGLYNCLQKLCYTANKIFDKQQRELNNTLHLILFIFMGLPITKFQATLEAIMSVARNISKKINFDNNEIYETFFSKVFVDMVFQQKLLMENFYLFLLEAFPKITFDSPQKLSAFQNTLNSIYKNLLGDLTNKELSKNDLERLLVVLRLVRISLGNTTMKNSFVEENGENGSLFEIVSSLNDHKESEISQSIISLTNEINEII